MGLVGELEDNKGNSLNTVSILVIVEMGLVGTLKNIEKFLSLCFNPCYSGNGFGRCRPNDCKRFEL